MPYNQAGVWIPEDDSVASRASGIISSDSPLIQGARTAGIQQANKRGLLSSSIAGQSAERAVLDTAIPMASQDASQAAARNLSAQQNTEALGRGKQSEDAATLRTRENIVANDRQRQSELLASYNNARASEQATITNNTSIPAATREAYLRQSQAQYEANILMMNQLWDIDIDFARLPTTTP